MQVRGEPPRSAMTGPPVPAEETVRVISHTLRWLVSGGWLDRAWLRDVVERLALGEPADWAVCPLCEETVCDDDCPLEDVRAHVIERRSGS